MNMPLMMLPDDPSTYFVDIQFLANLLQRCKRSLRYDIELGRLPRPFKIGRQIRWKRAELERWLQESSAGTGLLSNADWEQLKREKGLKF